MNRVFTKLKMLFFIGVFALSWSANGQTYPWPQEFPYVYGTTPTSANSADALSAYEQWKTDYVVNAAGGTKRVKWDSFSGFSRGSDKNSVSEGIAYGMLLSAYAGDKSTFDGLWAYYQRFPTQNTIAIPGQTIQTHIMNWKTCNPNTSTSYVDTDGSCSDGKTPGTGGATDAEFDAAMGLLIASYQWPTDPQDYESSAVTLIKECRKYEFLSSGYMKPGDSWRNDQDITNISYFSPAYYRIFKEYDNTEDPGFWDRATEKAYEVLDAAATNDGLVPDWCKFDGSKSNYQNDFEEEGEAFLYDAVRAPLRIAIDYIWHNESRAADYCAKTTQFAKNKGGVANLNAGYFLNGNPLYGGGATNNPTFMGCFSVGAMTTADQSFVTTSYNAIVNTPAESRHYFDATIRVLSLFIMTGNFYPIPPDACDVPDLGDAVQSLCQGTGGNLTLTASGAPTATTYEWYKGTTKLSGSTNTKTISEAGDYKVFAIQADGCQRSAKVSVVDGSITADFVGTPGPASAILENTSIGGVTDYAWTISPDPNTQGTITTEDAVFNTLPNGSYDVTLTVDNSGFGCADTDSKTKTVIVGDGVGLAVSDFSVANDESIYAFNLGETVTPVEKDYCSTDDMIAGAAKECPVFPCGKLEIVAEPAGTRTVNPWDGFGIEWGASSYGELDLSSAPYLSIKMYATSPVEVGLKFQQGEFTNDAVAVDVTTTPEVFTVDFSTALTGWDNAIPGSATITAWDAVKGLQILPFNADVTWEGTVTVEWFVVGAKSIAPPSFAIKKDVNGYTDYSNYLPDYYPNDPTYASCTPADATGLCYGSVPDWEPTLNLCPGDASTVTVNSCTAEKVRWFKGSTFLTEDFTYDIDEAGTYYVELINQGGTYRDSVVVTKGGAPEADFSYVTEDFGFGYRFSPNTTNANKITWDYGVPRADQVDPEAHTWEEGYHYYDAEGPYTVTLTAEDTICGTSISVDKVINVSCVQDPYTFTFSSSTHSIVNDTIEACGGETVTVSADAGSDLADITNYAGWFGFDGSNEMSLTDEVSFSPTDFSNYLKITTDDKCGTKVEDSIYVAVTPAVTAAIVYDDAKTVAAAGGALYRVFTTDWAGDGATYTWSVNGVDDATQTGLEAHIDFFNYGPGTHTVKVEVTGTCGVAEDEISYDACSGAITPEFDLSAADMTAYLTITDEQPDFYTYSWLVDGVPTAIDPVAGFTAPSAGDYEIELVANDGCTDYTSAMQVFTAQEACIEITAADVGVITGPVTAIVGDVETFMVADIADATYTWTLPADWSATPSTTYTQDVTVGTSGTITVEVSNACTSPAIEAVLAVETSEEITDVTVSASQNGVEGGATAGGGITADASFTGGNGSETYEWTVNGMVVPGNGPTLDYDMDDMDDVIVCVTVSNNVTSAPESCYGPFDVKNNCSTKLDPTSNFTPMDVVICEGEDAVFTVDLDANAANYIWSSTSGTPTQGSNTTTITGATADAIVSVTVEAVNNCGTGSGSASLTLVEAPSAEFTYSTSDPLRLTYDFVASDATADTYSWDFGGSGQTDSYTFPTYGTYDVTLTVSNSVCGASAPVTKSISVTQCDKPVQPVQGNVTPAASTEYCEGDIVQFSVPADVNAVFAWTYPADWSLRSTSATERTISLEVGASSGDVTITSTSVNGCDSDTETLSLNVKPEADAYFTYAEGNTEFDVDFTAAVDNSNLTYAWSFEPYDGSASATAFGSNSSMATELFTEGKWFVTLDVTGGCIGSGPFGSDGTDSYSDIVNITSTGLSGGSGSGGNGGNGGNGGKPGTGTGIADDFAQGLASIYPTAATEVVTIDMAGVSGTYEIVITNAKGRVVATETISGGSIKDVNVANYSAGMYLVRIQNGGDAFIQKFVKQ